MEKLRKLLLQDSELISRIRTIHWAPWKHFLSQNLKVWPVFLFSVWFWSAGVSDCLILHVQTDTGRVNTVYHVETLLRTKVHSSLPTFRRHQTWTWTAPTVLEGVWRRQMKLRLSQTNFQKIQFRCKEAETRDVQAPTRVDPLRGNRNINVYSPFKLLSLNIISSRITVMTAVLCACKRIHRNHSFNPESHLTVKQGWNSPLLFMISWLIVTSVKCRKMWEHCWVQQN